tara:strand:- start:926 stop:1069 length:144 start_codon:yes stop_codon:yes gene_type:complete
MVHPLHRRRQQHAENLARDQAEAAEAAAEATKKPASKKIFGKKTPKK